MRPKGPGTEQVEDYDYCMAIMCLNEHVILNGLRYHHRMSDSKRGYDFPLHQLWMLTLSKEERDQVLSFLNDNGVPAKDTASFTVRFHEYTHEPFCITYRYYVRNVKGDILVDKDTDGDWVAMMDTESVAVKTEVPNVIIDALWTNK